MENYEKTICTTENFKITKTVLDQINVFFKGDKLPKVNSNLLLEQKQGYEVTTEELIFVPFHIRFSQPNFDQIGPNAFSNQLGHYLVFSGYDGEIAEVYLVVTGPKFPQPIGTTEDIENINYILKACEVINEESIKHSNDSRKAKLVDPDDLKFFCENLAIKFNPFGTIRMKFEYSGKTFGDIMLQAEKDSHELDQKTISKLLYNS